MPILPLQKGPWLIKLSIETGDQSKVLLLKLGLLVKMVVREVLPHHLVVTILLRTHNRKHLFQQLPSISKKYFHLGGKALSEWTHSVRAVRETPVADYSAPGVISTLRIPYRPLIAVSPFRLILSVSCCK
jgi:hypothetical protein